MSEVPLGVTSLRVDGTWAPRKQAGDRLPRKLKKRAPWLSWAVVWAKSAVWIVSTRGDHE